MGVAWDRKQCQNGCAGRVEQYLSVDPKTGFSRWETCPNSQSEPSEIRENERDESGEEKERS